MQYDKNMSTGLRIAIVGGGAAGLFAAITAKEKHPKADIVVFERNQKLLAKVAITGGGRCNLTNSFDGITDLCHVYPRGHKLIKRLFNFFDYQDAYNWFESRGVELTTQTDHCVFPTSQDSASIVNCLVFTALQLGIKFKMGHSLKWMDKTQDGMFRLSFATSNAAQGALTEESFARVAITTGGSPRIEGLTFVSHLAKLIEAPVPSLFTFNIDDKRFLKLMGTVVDSVSISLAATKFKAEGPLLITHWGASGPAILKLSSHAARFLHETNYQAVLTINWVKETNRNLVENALQEHIANNRQKMIGSLRPFNIPARLWDYILEKKQISPQKRCFELGKKAINQLVEALTNDTYSINGKGKYKEEFVTCGGISLRGITPNTLESKNCKHLYFAGEVLDIDGITGGFNLQAAWTTGYVVGSHIANPDNPE